MHVPKLRTAERRIGVVGLYAAGKTVFLTSLVDHLKHSGPGTDFQLGKDGSARVRKFSFCGTDDGWRPFPYESARKRLVHGEEWPEKSIRPTQLSCCFERSDWYSWVRLKLYDLPGERMADIPMAGRDYAAWSRHTLRRLRNDRDYDRHAADFLELLDRPADLRESVVLDAYRHALARLALDYKGYISPSSFLLGGDGKPAGKKPADTLASERIVGLDAERQFAPLPQEAREEVPDLYEAFQDRYRAYRDAVALPLAAALRRCHGLIVLVDVPMILCGGVGMYNDNYRMLEDMLHALNPGQTLGGAVLTKTGQAFLPRRWRPSALTRLAFCASKVDQVHPMDQGRVKGLLEQMLQGRADDIDGAESGFWNCCAVRSAEPASDTERRMCGGLGEKDTGEESTYSVSAVPDEWPRDWEPGEYTFPNVEPDIPRRLDAPPRQLNLGRILHFVMGGSWI